MKMKKYLCKFWNAVKLLLREVIAFKHTYKK